MDTSDELRAQVKREQNRLVVTIKEDDQARAGIASLECQFVADSNALEPTATESPVGEQTAQSLTKPSVLEQLEKDLEREQELLTVTEKRFHDLKMKRQEYGPSTLLARESAELRESEKEVTQMKKNIAQLKTQIQQERQFSSEDSPPYLK